MNNPLLQDYKTPFETPPFSLIKEEHFLPAIQASIEDARREVDAIKAVPLEDATFDSIIAALEFSGKRLQRVSELFFNLNSAETSDGIQQLAQEISPLLTAFSNDIRLDAQLFERVKKVYDKAHGHLEPESEMLLTKTYHSFTRNGALLEGTEREQLRAIDKELSQLSLTFGENVLAETNAYSLHISDEKQLEGLPEAVKAGAAEEAQQRDKSGWVFTLDYPSYVPFMTYADNRELRKEISQAFGARAYSDNEHNNEDTIKRIVKLRQERAVLLGYKSHADYVLEERMAERPEVVNAFLKDLLDKAMPAGKRDVDALKSYAFEKDGIEDFESYDHAYYAEKVKQERYALNDELLKPYFRLERAIDGVFEIAGKLYGLQFEERRDIDTYHPDVRTWEVKDRDGAHKAVFYGDFFPRKGKRNGAWMTSFKGQYVHEGSNERPHVSIVCNFTKPTQEVPSLLTFNELTTLFHEFGHALHGMMANTTFESLSGTNVFWDFVELPSQVMENWCYEPEALRLFAQHYETGALIPEEYIQRIKEAASFMEGYQTVRQLSFGLLDMAWHHKSKGEVAEVRTFELEAMKTASLYEPREGSCMSCAFSHIFQGGYSAGYYSYKWAEVLDADAFEYFLEEGVFSTTVATAFAENVLSKGGTKAPMELYKTFRGRPPKAEALLKRAGLLEN